MCLISLTAAVTSRLTHTTRQRPFRRLAHTLPRGQSAHRRDWAQPTPLLPAPIKQRYDFTASHSYWSVALPHLFVMQMKICTQGERVVRISKKAETKTWTASPASDISRWQIGLRCEFGPEAAAPRLYSSIDQVPKYLKGSLCCLTVSQPLWHWHRTL